ncbi:hypothetical protein BDR03DRAFT_971948 [Suillus americanus]|nr:hypothetical protein BDR03DRAFT_971948 [Suillus americanus]
MSILPSDSTTHCILDLRSENQHYSYWKILGHRRIYRVESLQHSRNRRGRKLLISAIVPRPIVFVSTISEESVENLAPFS